jgi:hypothetical protein
MELEISVYMVTRKLAVQLSLQGCYLSDYASDSHSRGIQFESLAGTDRCEDFRVFFSVSRGKYRDITFK